MSRFKKGTMDGFKDVQPYSEDFEIMPDGLYLMQAVKTDIKEARNGNGTFVEVWMKVIEGQYKGRQIIKRFIWENSSPDAERIGRSQLRNLALACGIFGEFQDSDDLLNIPVFGNVCTERGKGSYPDRNGIKSFKPVEDSDSQSVKDDGVFPDEAGAENWDI